MLVVLYMLDTFRYQFIDLFSHVPFLLPWAERAALDFVFWGGRRPVGQRLRVRCLLLWKGKASPQAYELRC
jgi:hypothetical protein